MLVEAGASSGLKNIGQMEKDAKCVQTFLANTAEEASEILHLRMGLEPYKPIGNAERCPNECGSLYYLKGSGECPKCGKVV